jgi:hypothetical protein
LEKNYQNDNLVNTNSTQISSNNTVDTYSGGTRLESRSGH